MENRMTKMGDERMEALYRRTEALRIAAGDLNP
jgi:hypothetical protein